MSRNVYQKQPITPVKATKRRGSDSSSSLDLSDSDGYSAVGAISDSEDDDEEDVDAAEEEHMVTLAARGSNQSSPRPSDDEDEGDDENDPEDDEDEDEDDDDDDDDEEAVDDDASWEGFMSESGSHGGNSAVHDVFVAERRVRFDVPDSDGDTTETDDDAGDFFPDIFVDQSTLDPSFRREIEHDDPDGSSDSGSFWDLHGNPDTVQHMEGFESAGDFSGIELDPAIFDAEFDPAILDAFDDDSTPVATPLTASQDFSTAVSTPIPSPERDDQSLDGYQSDGDTTDDEDPPERPIRRKSRREVVEESSDSDAVTLIKPRRGKPRVGRFNLDSSGKKPVAVVNPRTGKLMIFTPQRLRRLDLSPEQFNFPFYEQITQSSPILSNSGNLMMGAMFSSNTFGDFMNNTQGIGPVEAFFPISPGSNVLDDISEQDEDEEDGEEDEGEVGLDVDDFLIFDGDSDEDDDERDGPDENDDYAATPGRPNTASSDITSLLGVGHLEHNSDIVGAFRRDQANSQLIRNGKATRESLAFSGPFFQGTLRGIKDGRLATTNVPISPVRKQKRRMPDIISSPLSGFAQKRKSSSEQHFGHKRQRSIPDVDLLQIH